ncbi:MAG TPA: diguanylate cyclase [Armatimonadota bacterium]|nr:diguanylate cyclase [Armatimonadota bacterium]
MTRRSSLESRLCFLISALLFVLLLAVCRVQMTAQRAGLIEAKIDKYQSLSKALSQTYTLLAAEQDQELYKKVAARFMAADPDISQVIVSDANGRVLFAKTRESAPNKSRRIIDVKASGQRAFLRLLSLPGEQEFKRIRIRAMVGPDERGTVTIRFGSRSIDAAIKEMAARLICAFALASLVGLLLSACLGRAFSYPLKRLIAATKSVETGDLDISVPVSFGGEIRDLAEEFNRMVVAVKESRDKLIERANTDSLTSLFNHRYFHERLRSELRRAERYGRPLSMIMLDIDHFKTLNDAHGHPVGDMVLAEIGEVLLSEVRRDIDIVARYGGEEFALILPETEARNAMVCAEHLRAAVEKHRFTGQDGETIPVTVSLGVAQYPINSSEREGLIVAADLAMYQSKSIGRNRATAFNNDSRTDKNADPYKLYLLLQATDMSTIEAMAAAVDAKGRRYPGFSKAVLVHALALTQKLGWSEKEQNDVRIASLLHDIGKLGISDAILNKREPLTEEELDIIRSHPAIGYAIIQRSAEFQSMLPGILYHHEWWDGHGYPSGLKGEDIPLIARVIAVVDSYHAMMTERPHCPSRTEEDARAELRRCAGTQFDPALAEAFLSILAEERAVPQAA